LTINSATGLISGTVSGSPATYSVSLSVRDQPGLITNSSFSITVNSAVAQQLVSFTLVNAANEQDIQTLTANAVLNLATLPSQSLNIRANTSPAIVGRVVLALTGAQTVNR
ncbi:hypothetical protein GZH53_00280, partial [Flavihumibacter sp. R14]|nr:hypothetical protein [Flavihumibacter soli]